MSEEYATTRQDFLTATASYLGLNPDNVGADSHVLFGESQGDLMTAVIHVYLKPSDIIGIGKRMQEIAKEQGDILEIHTDLPTIPDNAALRAEYDGLTQADKGRFGSFGKYVTWRMMNDKPANPVPMPSPGSSTEGRKVTHVDGHEIEFETLYGPHPGGRRVTHVDAPEEPEPTIMDAVWLHRLDCTHAQIEHASDHDRCSHRYLIQWSMLTDEQKQKAGKP